MGHTLPATWKNSGSAASKTPEELLAGPNSERAERAIRDTLEAMQREIERLREQLDRFKRSQVVAPLRSLLNLLA